ncbi:MAG: response regulator transcription factor [Bacteroidales bacterium]|nr:response regulator transcription factor [Bacteroidales bacterium]
MKKLKVHIVDDHLLFRQGLHFLLKNCEFVSVINESDNGQQFLEEVQKCKPDVVLMDIEMPIINGIEATREVLKQLPDIKVIALSMYSDEIFYREMLEAGARGFLLKSSKFDDVKTAIIEAYNGRNYFSPEILSSIIGGLNIKPEPISHGDLTKRELEVLLNICQGLSNQKISERLIISKRTVDKHRENILFKTNSKNTAELVVFAIKEGYFEI